MNAAIGDDVWFGSTAAGAHSLGQPHDRLAARDLLRRSVHQSGALWVLRHQAALAHVILLLVFVVFMLHLYIFSLLYV